MAAPHVSALVAMMMSRGTTDPSEIKARLYGSAIDLGDPGWDTLYGYGLIEPVAALGGQSSFLSYDNGYPDNYWYVNNGSERRFAVKFTPDLSAPFDVTEASVLVRDTGASHDFRLTLNSVGTGGYPDLGTNLAGPVTVSTVGDTLAYWYSWDFAGVPRTTNADYFLVFHWVSPDFGPPYIGGDTTYVDGRSYLYSSSGWSSVPTHDWYLRTVLLKDSLTVGVQEPAHRVARITPDGIVCVRPQPARRSVILSYTLARPGTARIEIVDLSGRVLQSRTATQTQAGRNEFAWNGRDDQGSLVPSGVYFVQLTTNGTRYRARVVLAD